MTAVIALLGLAVVVAVVVLAIRAPSRSQASADLDWIKRRAAANRRWAEILETREH